MSLIPVGTGSKGAKSLRKALQDDSGAAALQQTLHELKSLTRESLEDLAGRLSTIEKRMNSDESYKLREKEAKEALKKEKSRKKRRVPQIQGAITPREGQEGRQRENAPWA